MGVVLLEPHRRSRSDAIAALEQLLAEAKAGRVIGLAYVVMRQGYDYDVGAAGETRRSPTFTRGMLCLLDDELAKLIRG